LLQRASLGLHFTGATRERVRRMMEQMESLQGLPRIIQFLSILDTLAGAQDVRGLASRGFALQPTVLDRERMTRLFHFIHERLDQRILLPELARLAHLSDGAFSRFFHAHTNRTLPQFLNELRVGRACRLLAEGGANVTEVAFACGFNNLSNFNRQFRRLKHTTPRAFQEAVRARVQATSPPGAVQIAGSRHKRKCRGF
jgi:AraC-like DNA-binding protein